MKAARYSKHSFDALQRETTLSSVSVGTAIGWLAREDKIQFEKLNGTTYYYVYHKRYY